MTRIEPGITSDDTGVHYPDYDSLVAAEANGWIVTAMMQQGKVFFTWSEGPFATQREARNARVRLRGRYHRDRKAWLIEPNVKLLATTVRPLWRPS